MTNTPSFDIEDRLDGLAAGIDEAGRGPLAGPVVASAVIIPSDVRDMDFIQSLNDSKKVTKKRREALYPLIKQHCIVGVGIVEPRDIDSLNILQATFKAMKLATANLSECIHYTKPEWLLIDGNKAPLSKHYKIKTVVKGDSLSCSIAAASIIAKVTRDSIMEELHEKYPHYGWNSNAGYGSQSHRDAITQHGYTIHHRKSFEPVKSMDEKFLIPEL